MTYNFDPERWYENRSALIEARRRSGELDEEGFVKAVAALEEKYDEMLRRLDGTYRIPQR